MVIRSSCFTILSAFISIICVSCDITPISNVNDDMVLAFQEEDDTTTLKSIVDDSQSDLVSDFFEHVKEIFEADGTNASYEVKLNERNENNNNLTLVMSPKNEEVLKLIDVTTKRNKILAMFENMTRAFATYYTFKVTDPDIIKKYMLLKSTIPTSTKSAFIQKQNRKYFQQKTKVTIKPAEEDELLDSETLGPISNMEHDRDVDMMDQQMNKLSCITCDNVNNNDCNDPGNKLLPLIRCEHNTDICYTMQTPFGVVDRGCFNRVRNHTTYVCSCNLCNSIPMHDLPYTFTNKSKWLINVQETSHGRRLRKSVYNQMACIQCEVNQTVDEVPDINCLEGKYRVLPSQYCGSDEVCGIRSIKSEGYIWRGCIKHPRFNYLWTFCADDLCNFHAPTSLFDI